MCFEILYTEIGLQLSMFNHLRSAMWRLRRIAGEMLLLGQLSIEQVCADM
jgi:hypothetical protein